MKRFLILLALGLAYASHASTTFAQAFLDDRRLVEGKGVKAGDFELHPGLAAEGGYDSNYFQTSGVHGTENTVGNPGCRAAGCPQTANVNEDVIDVYRLRITPSFSFASRGARAVLEGGGAPPSFVLAGRLSASYSALFAADSAHSSQASNQNDVAANAGLGVNIFPVGTWGGDASIDYTRLIEASNDPDLRNAYKRDTIRAGGGIAWRPGGGLFTWRVGYLLNATLFESGLFNDLNNVRHTLQLSGSWKFLPRTALLYRGNATWLRYTNGGPGTLGDGEMIDSQIGMNGLISNYFGLLGMIGWAGTFYEPRSGAPQNFDSVIGQAQITWYPIPQQKVPNADAPPSGLSSVALGYTRNYGASYLGTFYQRDRGYLAMAYFFGERFVLSLQGGLSHISRPATFFDNTAAGAVQQQASPSEENRVDATAFLEYRVTSAFGINTTFRYDGELEHKVYPLLTGNNPVGDDLKFDRYQVYLGVRWFL